MLLRNRGHNRGVELGPYPLEALPSDPSQAQLTAILNSNLQPHAQNHPQPPLDDPMVQVARHYQALFVNALEPTAGATAPVATELHLRSRELKGAAYYLDAGHAGICQLPDGLTNPCAPSHSHALIIWFEFGRQIETDNPAAGWVQYAEYELASMRALEVGACLTGHLRALGFGAELHFGADSAVDLDRLALLSGIAIINDYRAQSPFFGARYAAVGITTDYAMAPDQPLRTRARPHPLRYWWGQNGAVSGRERRRVALRKSHLSRYPMENIKRTPRPTTLILDDEVPRVPKRAEFFMRARKGDLGEKAQREVARFAFKHPLTEGMMKPLRAMVPWQDGPVASEYNPDLGDPAANSHAIKSLSYHLGADLTGICEIPDYAWYSHGPEGQAIEIKHKYAVVMLIDQGYDTMDGASGDDWISGCQSMRGYIRGAEIAGVMADFLRRQGASARAQTNADSEVLHIPLILWAGLGELSRIGELVLNPFVGPRFKSVVLTTNLPLAVDQPIDFDLQDFCTRCLKCARECPVNAIEQGDKVMFNGYEIWKPDVERCTRYRVTNPKGSACGRCMKTCPLNKVLSADGALLTRAANGLAQRASWLKPLLAPWAITLDDRLGYGQRNPVKRWWQDLEIIEGRAQIPKATNERNLKPSTAVRDKASPVGYYPAADLPPAEAKGPVPVDRQQAILRGRTLETVDEARARREIPVKHLTP